MLCVAALVEGDERRGIERRIDQRGVLHDIGGVLRSVDAWRSQLVVTVAASRIVVVYSDAAVIVFFWGAASYVYFVSSYSQLLHPSNALL